MILIETGLPPPVRLCVAKDEVRDFLENLLPYDKNALSHTDKDVFMATVDLDCEYLPIYIWGQVNNADDIQDHLLSVFRRENPYIRVVALAIRPNIPKLFW